MIKLIDKIIPIAEISYSLIEEEKEGFVEFEDYDNTVVRFTHKKGRLLCFVMEHYNEATDNHDLIDVSNMYSEELKAHVQDYLTKWYNNIIK